MSSETIAAKTTLKVSNPEFEHEGYIPLKYTCERKNLNPPATIKEFPKETISLVLIIEDPNAPGGIFDHWMVWNIRPTEVINEDSLPGITAKDRRGEYRYTVQVPPPELTVISLKYTLLTHCSIWMTMLIKNG